MPPSSPRGLRLIRLRTRCDACSWRSHALLLCEGLLDLGPRDPPGRSDRGPHHRGGEGHSVQL